jgi:hypothetical protein
MNASKLEQHALKQSLASGERGNVEANSMTIT